ncbi:MAG: branched-chain amino acid transport system ATP-binding protein [Chloroflexota bacterium]|jgi:branched-chain amino acid transport system permease protein|nr:branched-chain amino acid transport system ATP-binding protein [Chloroflexota bacterium]
MLTPRRTNVLLVAFLAAVLPPLTYRLMPAWFPSSFWLLLGYAAVFAAAALSLNLLMGYAGQISLGHAALLGIGAFTSGLITSKLGQSMAVGIPAAALAGGLVALLVGLPALRLKGLYLAIITLSLGYMMVNSIFRMSIFAGGSAGVEMPRRIAGDLLLNNHADYLAMSLVVLLGIWLVDSNVTRSKLGRAFAAIREDEAVAQAFGINVSRYKLMAFVLSGAIAGLAGALYGHLSFSVSADTFSFEKISLPLVIMVVVGGLGSRVGVAVAAFFFMLFPQLPVLNNLHGWDLVIGAFLLMYTVARHPGGFTEMIAEARDRRRKRALAKAAQPGQDEDIEEKGAIPKLPSLPRPSGLAERPQVAGANLLEVEDVRVAFGGLRAVDGASLEVPRGQIVGLIGPNGAGKSTLFNAISGLVRPDSGVVRFLGQEIQDLAPHARAERGIARTFQNIGLAKSLTVRQNLLLAQHIVAGYNPVQALGFTRKTARVEAELLERADQALAALDFERFAHEPLRNLSHGQQRIVEIGCALVTAPELIMLDEPSAGMSPGAAENLALRLRDLRDELGRTVLLIEHNVPLVLDVCDYIYVLNYGSVLAHGSTAMIARQPEVIGAYFGEEVVA